MLRRFHDVVGLSPGFEMLDDAQQVALMRSVGISWGSGDGMDLVRVVGRWKNLRKSPAEAVAEAASLGDRKLAEAAVHFATYERAIVERGQVDPARAIAKTIEAINAMPEIGAALRSRFGHVLVDEWQDVTPLQFDLIGCLVRIPHLIERRETAAANQAVRSPVDVSGCNLFVVGNDDQSIHGSSGSDIGFLAEFSRHFPGAVTYRLATNWRSVPATVAASSSFVAANRLRIRKTTEATGTRGVPDAVAIREFQTGFEEAAWIARSCQTILGRGAKTSDLAVLFRTSSLAPVLERAFAAAGVPVLLEGAARFWDLPETLAVAGMICMAEDPMDRQLLDLSFGHGGMRYFIEAKVREMAGLPLWLTAPMAVRAVEEALPPGLPADRTGLWLDATEEAGRQASRFSGSREFVEHVRTVRAEVAKPVGVVLTCIQESKGREWQGVFVCGCESHMMPYPRTDDVEEERRMLYVAMTRARAFLSMSYARHRFARWRGPSDFLHEIADRTDPRAAQVIWHNHPARPSHMTERAGAR
jgi:DNA helicase-2/ATP-dependent DNA helicase PcrA